MRIAILLPMVWSVRNVVHAGVLRALARAGVETHLIVWCGGGGGGKGDGRETQHVLFDESSGVHPLIDPPGRTPRGKALLDAMLTSAFHRHHQTRSYAIYRRWFSRHDGPMLRARGALVEAAGTLAASPRGIAMMERAVTRMTRRSRDLEPVRKQLREIDPDLVWSTVNVSSREQPYRMAANDLGIPVATSILSFDNLTSRGPLARDKHYLVWGVRMQAQLLRLYPQLGSQQVSTTGTPQFDFHRRPEFRWTRERTLRALGLADGGRSRYLLYGASHAALTPEEPALVAALATRMGTRASLANHALVVRLHPLDDLARWSPVLRTSERVHLSPAFATSAARDGWTLPSGDDYARLTSSLAHADACLNVASTLSLDAAILDRPVICLDFSAEPDSPRDMLYAEYEAEHYAPLVQSGGLRLARNWGELLDQTELAIAFPDRDRALRARMVADECGPVDGGAAQRVARTLIALAAGADPTADADERSHRMVGAQ
jgi:hypothetical protein